MSGSELTVLERAHQLFGAGARTVALDVGPPPDAEPAGWATEPGHYRLAVRAYDDALRSAAQTDAAATRVITGAAVDHTRARALTGQVLAEARHDATVTPDNPLAQREAMRRRVARLRAQQAHVLAARHRAVQHTAALRGLRYRSGWRRNRPAGTRSPHGSRADLAVRAALSRLGRPYVWGATGPDKFDCSGLTQWSYAQAGIHLDRTTYQQIHDGIPVARWQIRPGDLVFPSTGHVQLAIGNNLVVEAPHAGAAVRISPLGAHVAIRRPVP